jgi:hypothetical protein
VLALSSTRESTTIRLFISAALHESSRQASRQLRLSISWLFSFFQSSSVSIFSALDGFAYFLAKNHIILHKFRKRRLSTRSRRSSTGYPREAPAQCADISLHGVRAGGSHQNVRIQRLVAHVIRQISSPSAMRTPIKDSSSDQQVPRIKCIV